MEEEFLKCHAAEREGEAAVLVSEPFVFSLQLDAEQRAREEVWERHDDHQSQRGPDREGRR